MPLSWVAAEVRARLLAQHRLGRANARELARSTSLEDALDRLRDTPYAHPLEGADGLANAQHRLAASVLWNMRVLAGWLPPGGAEPLRVLAAWFEIANVQARLAYFQGPGPPAAFELGTLETASRRLAITAGPAEMRQVLARSAWGDPGGEEPAAILSWMRAAWYRRFHALVPEAAGWADAALVLWCARARFGPAPGFKIPSVHVPAPDATSPAEMAAMLPGRLAWVVDGLGAQDRLWVGEARWWRRVEQDSIRMLSGWRPGPGTAVATAALLAADAWRIRAVLGAVARGRGAEEALDAVA